MEWSFVGWCPELEITDLVVIAYLLCASLMLDAGDRLVCKIVVVFASVGCGVCSGVRESTNPNFPICKMDVLISHHVG